MDCINIENIDSISHAFDKNIEYLTIGDIKGQDDNIRIAFLYSNMTYNDSIYMANTNFKYIHEFSMADQVITSETNNRAELSYMIFSPDATILLIMNYDMNYIYNTINYELICKWTNKDCIEGATISYDNTKVAFIDNHTNRFCVYMNGQELFSHKNEFCFTKFSLDSTLVMAYSVFLNPEHNIKIFNTTNGDIVYDLIINDPIRTINFTPDNNIIYFKGISHDKDTFETDLIILDVKTNQIIKRLDNDSLDMINITFSMDGKYLYYQLRTKGIKKIDFINSHTVGKYYYTYYNKVFYGAEYTSDYKYICTFRENQIYYKKIQN